MNTGELLDRVFFLYRNHFLVFVGIAAIPNLILLIFRLALGNLQLKPSVGTAVISLLAQLAISLVVFSASQAATIVAVSNVHLGRPASIRVAYAVVKDCLLEVILIAILIGFCVFLGLLLLIVPGILIALAWSLAIPVAVIENEGPLDALPRSSELTRGSRFRIFVISALLILLAYVVTVIFQAPSLVSLPTLLRSRGPLLLPTWLRIWNLIGSFLSSSLVTPISTIAISLIYYDQRVRKEGFDIQLMMSSIKSSSNNSPVSPANS